MKIREFIIYILTTTSNECEEKTCCWFWKIWRYPLEMNHFLILKRGVSRKLIKSILWTSRNWTCMPADHFIYLCLVQTQSYHIRRLGLQRQSILLSCLNYLYFILYFSDLVQSTEKSRLNNNEATKDSSFFFAWHNIN
jgi:hypothetical protein